MDSSHHRNNGSSSAVQNQAISSEESPCLVINGTTLDWSGRGTSHVDYNRNEELPLNQGRFLGYGVHGGVYETRCKGIPLAWKRKFCRTKIGKRELQEIEIIKRLNHRHIIKLVGTYTHRQFLGLLLWPVAVCDLADLMEDVDWLLQVYVQDVEQEIVEKGINWIQSSSDFHAYEDDDGRSARLKALGLWVDSYMTTSDAAIRYLENSTSCIASAVAYLHDQGVKHKDLKPSNVLLSANGLWLTDFGTATDFSLLTQSATEGGDRGTPKYFAPEVAAYAPSGRSADIFSLGCIFFEIITLAVGFTLEEMKALRPENDRSFQANLANIISWFRRGGNHTRKAADEYFMGLVRRMISPGATDRPTAREIVDEISMINGFGFLEKDIRGFYCGGCCTSDYSTLEVLPQGPCTDFEMQIVIGNTYHYRPEPPKVHAYTCFVTPSLPELVEKVHIFKHQTFANPRGVICKPPFEWSSRSWGSFEVGINIELRSGYSWKHETAQFIPGTARKGMLPMLWLLDFSGTGSETNTTFNIVCDHAVIPFQASKALFHREQTETAQVSRPLTMSIQMMDAPPLPTD